MYSVMRIQQNRQFHSLLMEREISTTLLESKMAFKRLILLNSILYLLRINLNVPINQGTLHQGSIFIAKFQEQPKSPANN